jgi:biopolymer transport protein ExbD
MIVIERRRKIGTGISALPPDDIVFLLLIFFMLSSDFVKRPGIDVQLPHARTSSRTQQERITVEITREGFFFVNGSQIAVEGLEPALQRALGQSGEAVTVFIRADRTVPLETAVLVLTPPDT